MPKRSDKTAWLAPELVEQLKSLFGTVRNLHARLALAPHVDLPTAQRAVAGYPVPAAVEQLIVARWLEWQEVFIDLKVKGIETQDVQSIREAEVRVTNHDYRDPRARDPITGDLVVPIPRWTLLAEET